MQPVAMECPACGVEVRGRFQQTLFQSLDADEQQLLENYLLAGFSIKALEQQTGMGYAAIRPRLDRLIEHYRQLREGELAKRRILDRLAAGEISASEAAERIARLQAD
jgi:hypothetical protein